MASRVPPRSFATSRAQAILGNVFIISLRALFRTPTSWRQRRFCVAISETAQGVGTFSPNRTSWRPLRSFIPAGAERFFVSMQPRFGARRSTPSGPTFAALWCHLPSRARRRPFQRGRIDQPVAFSRGWSLSADAFEDREHNALSCRLFNACRGMHYCMSDFQ